jgi:oxygen-independent coproporphyrinogen-3 oxidase
MLTPEQIPLSLYIHLPWCVQKCPYCDFNSHEMKNHLPETLYVDALLDELDSHLALINRRPLISIFFGGGTPSLFSAQSVERILNGVSQRMTLTHALEITLEANPGTVDQARFAGFRSAGVNRLSLGIQSLQNDKLATLGRIHDKDQACRAIDFARSAGFDNLNVDLMYGLPHQTTQDALQDIQTALSFQPQHFSWYQLTIEPNTLFYHQRPPLPADDTLWEMQLAGQQLLKAGGFHQYEVSAYAQTQRECVHNRNYWEFGDYLGIGAGAHSKITAGKQVKRFSQVKHPKDYLEKAKRHQQILTEVGEKELIFEFMLNALRLTAGVTMASFSERTGVSLQAISAQLALAQKRGLLCVDNGRLYASELGMRFLNDLVAIFLD